jgi:hypothetical protein
VTETKITAFQLDIRVDGLLAEEYASAVVDIAERIRAMLPETADVRGFVDGGEMKVQIRHPMTPTEYSAFIKAVNVGDAQ